MITCPKMAIRVLLLDDDADLLSLLKQALELDEFAVETCRTVQSATSLLSKESYDVVVSDLALEHTGGLAFCEELAKNPTSPPVLVLTGYEDARSAALRLGARRVLVKPVELDDLKQALREVVAPT